MNADISSFRKSAPSQTLKSTTDKSRCTVCSALVFLHGADIMHEGKQHQIEKNNIPHTPL